MVFGSLGFGIPCEPPSDEAKAGEVKRALSEREARVAQRPFWLRNAGEIGEPGCCRDTVSEAWGARAVALAPRITVFLASACAPSRSTLRESESGALFFGNFLLATQKKVTSRRAAPGEFKFPLTLTLLSLQKFSATLSPALHQTAQGFPTPSTPCRSKSKLLDRSGTRMGYPRGWAGRGESRRRLRAVRP